MHGWTLPFGWVIFEYVRFSYGNFPYALVSLVEPNNISQNMERYHGILLSTAMWYIKLLANFLPLYFNTNSFLKSSWCYHGIRFTDVIMGYWKGTLAKSVVNNLDINYTRTRFAYTKYRAQCNFFLGRPDTPFSKTSLGETKDLRREGHVKLNIQELHFCCKYLGK